MPPPFALRTLQLLAFSRCLQPFGALGSSLLLMICVEALRILEARFSIFSIVFIRLKSGFFFRSETAPL